MPSKRTRTNDLNQKNGEARLVELLRLRTGSGELRAFNSLDKRATVMFEPFDGDRIRECLNDWGGLRTRQRTAAITQMITLEQKHKGDANYTVRINELLRSLRKWECRYEIIVALDAALPSPKQGARRMLRVQYTYKATNMAGRRYSTTLWKDFGDGKLRSLALQALPGDLRAKLTGKYLFDFDGVNSDPSIILNECRFVGVPTQKCRCIRSFVEDRRTWIEQVCAFYCMHAGYESTTEIMEPLRCAVKRWPNLLANGASYQCLLETAGLPRDCPMETNHVLPLREELKLLKQTLLASPRNTTFVETHSLRLKRRFPEKSAHEIQTTLFSLLISTREDEILTICVDVVRSANRSAWGEQVFDQLSYEKRWVGSLVFDGQMVELHPDVRNRVDANGRLQLLNEIELELSSRGWDYKLDVKPNFGMQHIPVASAVEGARALETAIALYPSVSKAVALASAVDDKSDRTRLIVSTTNRTPEYRVYR